MSQFTLSKVKTRLPNPLFSGIYGILVNTENNVLIFLFKIKQISWRLKLKKLFWWNSSKKFWNQLQVDIFSNIIKKAFSKSPYFYDQKTWGKNQRSVYYKKSLLIQSFFYPVVKLLIIKNKTFFLMF